MFNERVNINNEQNDRAFLKRTIKQKLEINKNMKNVFAITNDIRRRIASER